MTEKVLRLFVVLAIIFGACCFAFNIVMNALVHNKKEIIVPNVVGKSLYDAMEELSNSSFGLKKDSEEFNQDIPAGTVLRQNPVAGMNVKEGKIVKVVVSQGGETVYVPDLVGRTLRSADISLKSATLVMGEVSKKYSIVANKNVVLSQDIAPGSTVDKNSVVNIVVSDGEPPEGIILMPDFVNKNIEEAKTWASRFGVALNIENKNVNGFEINTVVRQSPEPDSDITGLRKITLCTN